MPAEKDYLGIAVKYAEDVVSGEIAAGKFIILACQAFLDDLEQCELSSFSYEMDVAKATKPCRFIESLYHTKGKWALERKKITLEPWQVFGIVNVFGWVHKETGRRRYFRFLLLVPRKNGKSVIGAGIGLYMMLADGEYGAEVYSGATTKNQAMEVFRPAHMMASGNAALRSYFGVSIMKESISRIRDGSRFIPIIGKPGDGASPSCSITDEYHEHKDDSLLSTMETGMGARENPLSVIITTAGSNLAGPCYALQRDCEKDLLAGNPSRTFAMIYGIDAGDDWADPDVIRKANPNFDVSVDGEYLLARQEEAILSPRKAAMFRTKHLNQWVGAMDAFFDVRKWTACEVPGLSLSDFAGRECVIGLDLASKVDIAAMSILFKEDDGRFVTFSKYFIPEERLKSGPLAEAYLGWVNEGRMTATPGEIIDFAIIRDAIIELSSVVQVREVAYDPHQATMLVTDLMAQGAPCIEVRPTVLNFSEPMKQLDAFIRTGGIAHDGDPIMTWMLGNVVAQMDAKDNVYPRKDTVDNKIDGVIALLSALARCITANVVAVSPYDIDPSFSMVDPGERDRGYVAVH